MLLVTKAGAKYPGMWAAADPTNRIVMIDVRDKKRVLTKPVGNAEWTEHPRVNSRDRDMVITAAERAIARLEVESEDTKIKSKEPPPKGKNDNAKSGFLSWLLGGLGNVFTAVWAKRRWGSWSAVTFVCWRA